MHLLQSGLKLSQSMSQVFDMFAHEVCQSELLRTEYTAWFKHCLATFRPADGQTSLEKQVDIRTSLSSLSGSDRENITAGGQGVQQIL